MTVLSDARNPARLADTRLQEQTAQGYMQPSAGVAALLAQEPPCRALLSPDGRHLLLLGRRPFSSIEELSRPTLGLAGLRLDPARRRLVDAERSWSVTIVDISAGSSRLADLSALPGPPDALLWSPDSNCILATVPAEGGAKLFVAPVGDGRFKELCTPPLNSLPGTACCWLPDSSGLLCLAQAYPGEPGWKSRLPSEPSIEESLPGVKAPVRTYRNLLKGADDDRLFDWYFTSTLIVLGLDGALRDLDVRGVFARFEPSPSGRHVLLERIVPPYPHTLPLSRFARTVDVLDLQSGTPRRIVSLPAAESIPLATGSVRPGPRAFGWRDDADETLVFAEALDGGDASAPASERDHLQTLAAPFDGQPETLTILERRFGEAVFSDGVGILVSEWWWDDRLSRVWLVTPEGKKKLFEYSFEDAYADPGSPVTRPNGRGRRLLFTGPKKAHFYMSGDGATARGYLPFLDRYSLSDGSRARLFQSGEECYEKILAMLSAESLLISREQTSLPPNYFVADLADGSLKRLTDLKPAPLPGRLEKSILRYRRKDGLELSATLYLPPGRTAKDGPFPVLVWIYPQEFRSAGAAGQFRNSPNAYATVGWHSPLLLLMAGYAILDDPSLPIVSVDGGKPNDRYAEQLSMSAQAAVDALVERGLAVEGAIAVGGHSYGAFTAANLLARTRLFAAGIARSGAFNRTLTPFGFQNEDRTLWEAPEVYNDMSPFSVADRIEAPLLLIHGEDDDNPGTNPMQSERMFGAMKGLGKTARLVLLPKESHGYRAGESIQHTLWEMERWLDRYVMKPFMERKAQR